jgi:Phosphotransferase enzyme family
MKREIMSVPFRGHILINTSGGYKVFNLYTKTVVTKYEDKLTAKDFTGKISNLKKLEKLGIAPKVRDVDYQNHIIIEEFINLPKANFFYPINSYFYEKILPVWKYNVENYPRKKINCKEYILTQKLFIFRVIEELKESGFNKKLLSQIQNFVENVSNQISSANFKNEIELSISHGDLHAWNILLNKRKAIVIDWDTFKERSLYHDVYYMFFHNIFGGKNVNYPAFLQSLETCLENIEGEIPNCKKSYNEYNTNASLDMYRSLFYLEYIYLDFEKRLQALTDTDSIQRRLINIQECIDTFTEVELTAKQMNQIPIKFGDSN